MSKRKLVFFLKEYRFSEQYFMNILKKLESDYEIIVLHTSKLENSNVKKSVFNNIDVSYYSILRIKQILKQISPESILLTNIRSLLDINVITLSNELKIKSIYIEHGLTLNKIVSFKKSNIFHSLKKYFIYSLNTLLNILSSKNKVLMFNKIFNSFVKNDYSRLTINNFLFYSNYSKTILENLFDMSKSSILYSGYPIVENENDLQILKLTKPKKQIVFIQQPLIADKFSNQSYEEEIEMFNYINDVANKNGFQFVLKLHPRSTIELYKNLFEGVIALQEDKIESVIANSEIVIGYFSTALLTALILEKKLLIYKQENILTDEIDIFATENNYFRTFEELEILIKNLVTPSQIDIINIAGEINSYQDRYNKIKEILN